jgi:MFS family permease
LQEATRIAAARRITGTLLVAQSLGSAGFLVASTVNPIVATSLGGSAAWAGAATATYQAGAALLAYVWGLSMDRLGRRDTLGLGIMVGAFGAALAWRGVTQHALVEFLVGVGFMGMANSALQLGRFVAAEVNPPDVRGRAISYVVVGGTVGGVLGPFLVGPAGATATRLGFDELSGPYATSAAIFALVTAIVLVRLRPEPALVAREVAAAHAPVSSADDGGRRTLRQILALPGTRLAIAALVFGQAVMVALMVITSVHMKEHHHALSGIATVISSHIFGMYAFSVVSGRLADAWGRRRVITCGAALLVLSCLAAPLSPRLVPMSLALFLLGLGWNLCYVAGSALLSDQLRPSERATTQGFNDTLIGVASALGALASGIVFDAVGYAVMAALSAAAAMVPLVLVLRHPDRLREPEAAEHAPTALEVGR